MRLVVSLIFAMLATAAVAAPRDLLAPTGTLRAVYLSSNPVQAIRDPGSGQLKGVSVDLAAELARRLGVPFTMEGTDIPGVIEAVRSGRADIGFLANDPSRQGPIVFSQTYLRNPQSIAVPEASAIRTFDDIDRPDVRIGASKGDSVGLYLSRTLKSGKVVDIEGTSPQDARRAFAEGRIDGFGASRQRLLGVASADSGLRILPGSLFGVPQAIIVAAGQSDALAEVNGFIADMRSNGFLAASIARAANGTEMEPAPK